MTAKLVFVVFNPAVDSVIHAWVPLKVQVALGFPKKKFFLRFLFEFFNVLLPMATVAVNFEPLRTVLLECLGIGPIKESF